ncbi:MAG: HAD family hydrolase [Thermoguttaceae bacterium]
MPLRFFYFDLGQVLLRFDVGVMCQQMASVAGIDPAEVFRAVFDTPLQRDYELGRLTTRQFYEEFCRQTATRPDFQALLLAASDIFELNTTILPVVTHLAHAGYRLGVLSNTCQGHWEHCLRRFAILQELFEVHALSYRLGAAKPDRAVFHAAAQMAGAEPQEIFFTDDIAGHVAGARAAGLDAVQYTSTAELAAAIRCRGIRFNY